MNCSQLRHLIELNPLSSLGATALEDVRGHAETCPACAEIVESVAGLERELAGLPEIDVRPELCDRIMQSISTENPVPGVGIDTGRTLFAQILKNLSFATATIALVAGAGGAQWLRNFISFDVALELDRALAFPSSSTSAWLTALACLLFLAGLALSEGASSNGPYSEAIDRGGT